MRRRVAGAPITWGVCEVPGWGYQIRPERVLTEMASIGLTATELGPDGYLPADPIELRRLLGGHRLELAAGFIPVLLHEPEAWQEELAAVTRQMRTLAEAGASMAVVTARTGGSSSYEETEQLDEDRWGHLVVSLAELDALASDLGIGLGFHPHYGTVVEGPREIHRLLETSPVGICLDTGHVMVGGGDPVAIAEAAAGRVVHVHLKDVDADLAERVRARALTYRDAVAEGLYRPLGTGDVDIPAILAALDGAGYQGWYVLEQDTVLTAEPSPGAGPVTAAAESYRYLTEGVPAISGPGEAASLDA